MRRSVISKYPFSTESCRAVLPNTNDIYYAIYEWLKRVPIVGYSHYAGISILKNVHIFLTENGQKI